MKKYQILGVFTGKTITLSNNIESAIIKHPRELITIKKNLIVDDDITNKKYHGGPMRVIHHYSQKNYQHLKEKFPEIADRFIPGSFGENIITEELTENELNIGDIYQLGSAKVQLTVPRRPCSKINLSYNDNRILKEVIEKGKTGWFYKVLEEGEVRPGDYLELLESPYPGLSVLKLHIQGYGKNRYDDNDFLKKCLKTEVLDQNWQAEIEKVLLSN